MRVQCSIQGSTLGGEIILPNGDPKFPNGLALALTESPLKALQGNQDPPGFYGVQAAASSPPPSLCKYSCDPRSDDDLQNALNYFEYVTSHTWSEGYDGEPPLYSQKDEIDPNTLDPTGATPIENNDPSSFGNPPIWNDQISYLEPPNSGGSNIISGAGPAWDKTPTRTAIVNALNSVDWSLLWKTIPTPRVFLFDRSTLATTSSGPLPLGGSHTGNIFSVDEPNLSAPAFLGSGGQLVNIFEAFSGYASSGDLLLQRMQIQARNIAGSGPEYIIVEQISTATGVSVEGDPGSRTKANALADVRDFFRLVDNGVWSYDNQIIQLPDPDFDYPQIINTPLGRRVKFGTLSFMVVGLTFEQWMQNTLGDDWRNHAL